MSLSVKPETNPERERYYEKVDREHISPLWNVLGRIVTPEPTSNCVPHLWKYQLLRALLMEAGPLITAEEAERRVLILENPGLRGDSKITTSLYAGLQLVVPGEIAPAHRHTQSALRFIMEGSGAHTAVGGERTYMSVGDFVITPSWEWHDHGNESNDPMIWLDGLDIPVVQFFDASFAENLEEKEQRLLRPVGDSLARYGNAMLPVEHKHRSMNSPILSYPYERTCETLELMSNSGEPDACHGFQVRYVNPIDGRSAMPTISTFMQLLPDQFSGTPYRSTDATVFVAVEGSGCTTINGKRFDWAEKDIFVVPSWAEYSHDSHERSILFSYSDRVCQERLGLFREKRM